LSHYIIWTVLGADAASVTDIVNEVSVAVGGDHCHFGVLDRGMIYIF